MIKMMEYVMMMKNDDNEGDGEGKGKEKKKISEQDRPGPAAGCRTVNKIPSGAFWGGNSTEMERSREAQSFEIATHPHYCTTYVVWTLRSGPGLLLGSAEPQPRVLPLPPRSFPAPAASPLGWVYLPIYENLLSLFLFFCCLFTHFSKPFLL